MPGLWKTYRVLTKKTLLFGPVVYLRLAREAKLQGISVDGLVRRAVLDRYGLVATPAHVHAVRKLTSLARVKGRGGRGMSSIGEARGRE